MNETVEYYYRKYGYRSYTESDYVHDDNIPTVTSSGVSFVTDKVSSKYSYSMHRWNGPARIWISGRFEWWFMGKMVAWPLDPVDHNNHTLDGPLVDWAIKNDIDLNNLTDDDVNLIKIVWA